jgi:hypothetical protein
MSCLQNAVQNLVFNKVPTFFETPTKIHINLFGNESQKWKQLLHSRRNWERCCHMGIILFSILQSSNVICFYGCETRFFIQIL